MIYDASPLRYDTTEDLYDYNGNTSTKVVGSDTTSYAWDYENRLTSVTLPGSGTEGDGEFTIFFSYPQKAFSTPNSRSALIFDDSLQNT